MQNVNVIKRKGRPSTKNAQNVTYTPSLIDFSNVTKLSDLNIDSRMMNTMKSGLNVDNLFSHEGGIPAANNIMIAGSPGVGKTTILLDVLSKMESKNCKTLFISGEMGQKQMFKYTQRFPQFGNVTTLFINDYLEYNTKDIIEQILSPGWDCVLIDSVAEVIDGVRDDNGWDRKMAENWLVQVCTRNNKGENKLNKYTSFLLIQQMTKGQDMVGSNKLKHLTDAALFLRRDSERDGGQTYMEFEKNRNGNVNCKLYYELSNNNILYSDIEK
jgi:DNA repair protein RadA/Sms